MVSGEIFHQRIFQRSSVWVADPLTVGVEAIVGVAVGVAVIVGTKVGVGVKLGVGVGVGVGNGVGVAVGNIILGATVAGVVTTGGGLDDSSKHGRTG